MKDKNINIKVINKDGSEEVQYESVEINDYNQEGKIPTPHWAKELVISIFDYLDTKKAC